MELNHKKCWIYKTTSYHSIFYWPVFDEKEVEDVFNLLKKRRLECCIIAFEIKDWNFECSPWNSNEFGDGAKDTLQWILETNKEIKESKEIYCIGYSLAGLFSLWASTQTDVFTGVASCSASFWFEHFMDYIKENEIHCDTVYLSLGKKECKTRHPVLSTIKTCYEEVYEIIQTRNIKTIFELQNGNHFYEVPKRITDAIEWLLKEENL